MEADELLRNKKTALFLKGRFSVFFPYLTFLLSLKNV